MDATVQAALVSGVTDFKASAFSVLAVIVPLAILAMATPALLKKGIKWFRGIAHL